MVKGGEREKLLTHNTIRRLRLLRWILKDPRDYYFFVFFHFHSSIIISEERIEMRAFAPIRAGVCVPPRVHSVVRVYACVYMCVHAHACVCVRSYQVELGRAWVGLDAWKPWTTLGRLVGFPPRLSARIEAHRHGSNVGTTAAA